MRTPATARRKGPRFTVRKQSSGYTSSVTWYQDPRARDRPCPSDSSSGTGRCRPAQQVLLVSAPTTPPVIASEDAVLGPDGHSYAGIPLGTVEHNGKPVNVLRYTRAAQARSGREPRFCVEGYSHWNPVEFLP